MQGGVFGAVAPTALIGRLILKSAGVTTAPSLELIGITKRFGAMAALDDVSVKIEAGAFHALLGENGAGKSTLVKCAMGYYAADEGQILLNDRRSDDRPSAPGARSRPRHGLSALHAWCRT
jgi:ABC-type branched-subunit amino acid transport system ATPase component